MFGPFPFASNAIQQNMLERAFIDPLLNKLAYRQIAAREKFPGRIGQTLRKTKMGLMIPNMTALAPNTNTNIDNGLTPINYTDEQYDLTIAQYPQPAPQVNLMDDQTTVDSFLMRNTFNLGIAQATCVDRLARAALFNAYMSGNTVVTATLGAPGTSVAVDDIRGFQTVVVSGNVTAVSSGNPLSVSINGTNYLVSGFTTDSVNVSSAAITGGISGTIITTTNVSTTNGTAGNYVISNYAPLIVRPNARRTTAALQASDMLTCSNLRSCVAYLANNGVPRIDGAYNIYLNSTMMNELYNDPEFQLIQRGTSVRDPAYQRAWIYSQFLDLRFIETTETYVQPPQPNAPVPVAQTVQRAIICGQDSLIESYFEQGMDAVRAMAEKNGPGQMQTFPIVTDTLGKQFNMEGFSMWLRGPIDRLGQIVDQTSNYVGNFTVPTDVTTTSAIIPTASSSYFKRGIVIETA